MFDPASRESITSQTNPETASPLELWRRIFWAPSEWRIKEFGKDMLFWVIVATLLLGVAQGFYWRQVLGQPFGGFLAYYEVRRPGWYVHSETPPWWPGLEPVNGIHHHDKLSNWPAIPINQEQFTRYVTAAPTVSERVERQGQTQDVIVPVVEFQFSHLVDLRSGDLLTAMGFWLLALAIYVTRPRERVNRILALLFCLAALNAWVSPPLLILRQQGLELWIVLFDHAVVLPLIGAVLIHAVLLFPTRSRFCDSRPLRFGIYAAAVTLGLLFGVPWWLFWHSGLEASGLPTLSALIEWANKGTTGLLAAGLGLLVIRTGWMLYSHRFDRRVKRQARVMLLGLGVASLYLAPVLYRMGVGPDGQESTWSEHPALYLGLAITPILLTMDILRQKRWGKQRIGIAALLWVAIFLCLWLGQVASGFLLDMDLSYTFLAVPVAFTVIALRYQSWGQTGEAWLASGACWLAVIIGVSGVAAGILHAWLRNLHVFSADLTVSPFVPIFIIILGISILWSSQVRWSGYFGALLHWQSRNYKAANRFAQRIAHQTNLNYLPHLVAQALVEELALESAGLWLWDENRQQFWLQGEAGQWATPAPASLPVAADAVARLHQTAVFRLDNPDIPLADWLKPLHDLAEIVIPLSTPDRLSGLLALGKRWDEDTFDQRDLDIVSLIAQQTTLLLLYAEQLATLRRLPGIVDAVQEQERAKIAQELHDTVQQFLGRLPFTLETIRELLLRKPFRATQLYRQLLTDIESAARTLREIRSSLTAADVHSGLIAPIQHLANQVQQRTGASLKVTIDTGVDQTLPLPARHALYRVVQQALDNVESHAQAQQVEVELRCLADQVYFCVRDDGRGSSVAQRQQASYAGHVGLTSMEARVQNLGGKFCFVSSPDAGTEASGWIPIPPPAPSPPVTNSAPQVAQT